MQYEALNHAFRDLRICATEIAKVQRKLNRQGFLVKSAVLAILMTTIYFNRELKDLNDRIEELEQKGD